MTGISGALLKSVIKTGVSFSDIAGAKTVARNIVAQSAARNVALKVKENDIAIQLQRMMRWEQLRTAFRSSSVNPGRYELKELMSGRQIEAQKYYQKLDPAPIEKGYEYYGRFVDVFMAQKGYEEFQKPFPSYYILGPRSSLMVAMPNESRGCAQFPGIQIEANDINFIVPRHDDLVMWRFCVLDRDQQERGSYAFDMTSPVYFSKYDYAEEEQREFMLLNAHIMPDITAFSSGLKTYLAQLASRQGGNPGLGFPQMKTRIFGPARKIEIEVPGSKFGPKHDRNFELSFLGLVKTVEYELESGMKHDPDLDQMVPTITVKRTDRPLETRDFRLNFGDGLFGRIWNIRVDDKMRFKLPADVLKEVRSDGSLNRIVL